MAGGIALGRLFPHLDTWLGTAKLAGTSLPIAIGLLVMMYPVLAKVRYRELSRVTSNRRLMVPSLVLNWLVGPALMFALAWLMLPDLPAYRTGLIIVGLARCIAMVFIWNDLAGGDREAAAVLVALNSLFQIVAFAALAYFYLHVLPSWLGLSTAAVHVSVWAVAKSVLIFLGIPLAAGWASRSLGEHFRGRDWYEEHFIPRVAPVALYGLLFTVVLLFALQGNAISRHPGDVARIALPLLAYFATHVGRVVRPWLSNAPFLPLHSHVGLHRGQQQLRAGDRGGDRGLRRDKRAGPCRCRRTAHRGPGAGGFRLRRVVGQTPLLPDQGGHFMNCFDCASLGHSNDAVAVCADCGAALCHDHAHVSAHWLTRTAVINRTVRVEPPARMIRCGVCQAAHDAAPATHYGATG